MSKPRELSRYIRGFSVQMDRGYASFCVLYDVAEQQGERITQRIVQGPYLRSTEEPSLMALMAVAATAVQELRAHALAKEARLKKQRRKKS